MSILQSLTISTRPEKATGTLRKRERLLVKLEQQLAMAKAKAAGETFTVYKTKWIKNPETGQQEKTNIPRKVKGWWFKRNGICYFEVRYGNKPLELAKGKHSIEVGDEKNLVSIIETIQKAAIEGELDPLLEKVTSHLSKKK